MKAKNRTPRRRAKFNRRWLIALALLLIVVVVFAVARNNKTSPVQTTTPNLAPTNGEKQQSAGSATAGSTSKTDSAGASSGQPPRDPYGNFVSSHSAGFNDTESSTCLTSAGATCQITFTNDGVSKSLDQKTTDGSGAAYWTWKPQDIGLTAGSWQVKASAKLNGQTASTVDSRNLEISP